MRLYDDGGFDNAWARRSGFRLVGKSIVRKICYFRVVHAYQVDQQTGKRVIPALDLIFWNSHAGGACAAAMDHCVWRLDLRHKLR